MKHHESIWTLETDSEKKYPALNRNIRADVLIIGAGITGITAALKLMHSDKTIVVIDSKQIGSGTTGYSTANLYMPTQVFMNVLKRKFDETVVNKVLASRNYAINFIENTIIANKINCQFIRRPLYLFASNKKSNQLLYKEVAHFLKAGVNIDLIKAPNEFPLPIHYTQAAVLPNQARFNPLCYLQALASLLTENSVDIYENTAAIKIIEEKDEVIVYTDQNNIIRAKKMIIATHIPKGINKTHFLAYPYRSYAIAVKLKQDDYPMGHFWDLGDPFYSISSHNIESSKLNFMIFSGYHHKTGHPQHNHQSHYDNIKRYILRYFDVQSFEYGWSAQHYQSADGLPYIGLASNTARHTYISTAYHTDGLVYGTVGGIILADLLLEKENPWESIYNSNRFTPMASSKRFIKENTKVLCDYVKGHLDAVDSKTFENVPNNQGEIVKIKNKKCAVYRDSNSKLHVVSAICSHLYCVVKWNDAEKSWDCPCHGSRFTVEGTVIEGPALMPLKKIEVKN